MVEAGAYDASNFNQLLSYLGNMTPQQRAQVGQMHQNDFEVITALSLINSAEARAKQAMMTQQAMGQPAAPPVNKQVIAETAQNALPEEVGIGALPERSLTGMADGGIVGYADGGGMMGDGYNMAVGYEPNRTPAMSYAGGGAVESYAPGGSTDKNGVERYAEEGYTGRSQFVRDIARIPEMYTNWWEQQRAEDEAKAVIEKERAEKRKAREEASRKASFFNYMFGTPEKEAEGKAELAAIQTAAPATTASATEKERRRMDESRRTARESEQVSAAANQAAAASAGQRPPATGGGAPTRPASAATQTAPAARTPEDFARMYERASSAITAEDPASAERKMLQSEIIEAARARQEAFDKEVAARGDRYKSREERLARREEGLGKDAKTNEGLALLSAAAAVLQPGGLAAGLMKAANVAIPQYQAGLDKLKAAQERIEEGRDRIDELRQNYDDLTSRERRQLADDVSRSAIEARKLGIDGIMAAQGVKEKKAASIYDSMVKQELEQMQQTGAMARTITSGEYGVKAAQARNVGMGDLRMAQLAETTRKNIVAEAQKLYKYDPGMQQQYIQTAMRQAVQQNPGLAEYMGVTGGGVAPSQSDPLGILGTKP